ncbi:class I SAM-dependent methyltransferase [Pandoraea sp. PE-S2T-3]|uniref:class I SAM-dependent methyltransferase n=1 Tax=Pandoraea sp. PE-S2T-3 TaxID=1986993 RepID=UPI000B3F71DD|nr:class I SAM-dependent methyltransferase [Pandoraea sp. PE-S2T-3]
MTDFESMYRDDLDPWSAGISWYERRKRTMLMASLPHEGYHHALELGCGTGHATRLLALRCATVRAVDISPTAIAECSRVLAQDGTSNVQLEGLCLPDAWPSMTDESVDLVIVSELSYYFSDKDLETFVTRCLQSLAIDGDWVMCHCKTIFHDRQQTTEQIRRSMERLVGIERIVTHDDAGFGLDVWRKYRASPG